MSDKATGNPPEGFNLAHDVVSESAWSELEKWLKSGVSQPQAWESATASRKVAQFGFHYDYKNSKVDFPDGVPPIPAILKRILLDPAMLENTAAADQNFTQCVINWYEPEDETPWTIDHPDLGPVLLVYCFGEHRPLKFRRAVKCDASSQPKYENFTEHPRHGSRYILSGPSRENWEHEVPKGWGRRVSIAFRTHRDG